jgi:hypothetical protein
MKFPCVTQRFPANHQASPDKKVKDQRECHANLEGDDRQLPTVKSHIRMGALVFGASTRRWKLEEGKREEDKLRPKVDWLGFLEEEVPLELAFAAVVNPSSASILCLLYPDYCLLRWLNAFIFGFKV